MSRQPPINFDSPYDHWVKEMQIQIVPTCPRHFYFTRLSPDFTAPLKLTIKRGAD